MATKKKARPKKSAKRAARKPAARKPARKSAVRKGAVRKSTVRKSTVRKSAKRVRAAVEKKARQGLDVAREGLERLKQSTVSLIGEVKERLAGEGDAASPH
jgi:hypothetical protein